MKNLLLKNWTLWRTTRLAFAILFIVVGLQRGDTFLALGGVFLFFHAILNRCAACVGNSCDVNPQSPTQSGK
ncbi:MAG: hypothetical protein IT236_19190 [Bacteroidia bacterium]|nr:hypothetical protein [Bacteroidia bacterium]